MLHALIRCARHPLLAQQPFALVANVLQYLSMRLKCRQGFLHGVMFRPDGRNQPRNLLRHQIQTRFASLQRVANSSRPPATAHSGCNDSKLPPEFAVANPAANQKGSHLHRHRLQAGADSSPGIHLLLQRQHKTIRRKPRRCAACAVSRVSKVCSITASPTSTSALNTVIVCPARCSVLIGLKSPKSQAV